MPQPEHQAESGNTGSEKCGVNNADPHTPTGAGYSAPKRLFDKPIR
jgi:hypothetical protein